MPCINQLRCQTSHCRDSLGHLPSTVNLLVSWTKDWFWSQYILVQLNSLQGYFANSFCEERLNVKRFLFSYLRHGSNFFFKYWYSFVSGTRKIKSLIRESLENLWGWTWRSPFTVCCTVNLKSLSKSGCDVDSPKSVRSLQDRSLKVHIPKRVFETQLIH